MYILYLDIYVCNTYIKTLGFWFESIEELASHNV